jgi:hypothetical protein
LPRDIDSKSASKEARQKRERKAKISKRYRERGKPELLDLLELRTVNYLKYGGNFGKEMSPRRYDYQEKSREAILKKLEEVEFLLRAEILGQLKSRGHTPDKTLELDLLEAQLLKDIKKEEGWNMSRHL